LRPPRVLPLEAPLAEDTLLRNSPRPFPKVHEVRPGDIVHVADAGPLVYDGKGKWVALSPSALAFVQGALASQPKPQEAK
jgi:hypothetical protein